MKAVWAAMPADVSLLHLLFYISSAGNFDLLLDTEGGAQQDRFVEGAGTLAGRVGESLGERLDVRGAGALDRARRQTRSPLSRTATWYAAVA